MHCVSHSFIRVSSLFRRRSAAGSAAGLQVRAMEPKRFQVAQREIRYRRTLAAAAKTDGIGKCEAVVT